MKKAGIIIGVVVVLIAVALFGISQVIENKNAVKLNNPSEVINEVDVNNDKEHKNQNDNKSKEPQVVKPVESVRPLETVTEKTVEKTVSAVSTINKNTLGEVFLEKEEIVVISAKRLVLVDEEYGSKSGKMLTYCFDVLTNDNTKLVLFMTAKSYENYNIGDKLMVRYDIYKNINDVIFPVVLSVSSVN